MDRIKSESKIDNQLYHYQINNNIKINDVSV